MSPHKGLVKCVPFNNGCFSVTVENTIHFFFTFSLAGLQYIEISCQSRLGITINKILGLGLVIGNNNKIFSAVHCSSFCSLLFFFFFFECENGN